MDVQKTMEFILEQQAAPVVLMNRLTEAQRNTKRNAPRLTVPTKTRTVSRAESDARLDKLEELMKKTRQEIHDLGVKIDALAARANSRVPRPEA